MSERTASSSSVSANTSSGASQNPQHSRGERDTGSRRGKRAMKPNKPPKKPPNINGHPTSSRKEYQKKKKEEEQHEELPALPTNEKEEEEEAEPPPGAATGRAELTSSKEVKQELNKFWTGEDEYCAICVEPIEFWAVGICNHRKICVQCCLRRRMLYQQKDCPLCRRVLDQVVVSPDPHKPFEQFDLSSMEKLEDVQVYFGPDSAPHINKLARLWELRCPQCDKTNLKSLSQLKSHVQQQHNLVFCKVCLRDRKVFLQEQKLYSHSALKAHLKSGDKDTQVVHARCHFCEEYFFDQDKLYEHLHAKHETCFLCSREGRMYEYYHDYAALEDHFRKDHFLCEEPECREKKFVAFKSEVELQVHQVQIHGQNLSKSEKKKASHLKLEFGVRTGVSSEQAEPEPAPEPVQPLDTSAHEQFPTLDGSSPRGPPPAVLTSQWGRPVVAPPEEQFPALEGSRGRGTGSASASWGRAASSSQSQLLDSSPPLSHASGGRGGQPSSGSRSRSSTAPALTSEEFPSLPPAPPRSSWETLGSQSRSPTTTVWGTTAPPPPQIPRYGGRRLK